MRYTLLLLLIVFSSCEVYERYYISTTATSGVTDIIVKVKSAYRLPKKDLLGYQNTGTCKICYEGNEKSNCKNILLTFATDTVKSLYKLSLPHCSTLQLYPTTFGEPDIEYVIINKTDTVFIRKGLNKDTRLHFKKKGNQQFVLSL